VRITADQPKAEDAWFASALSLGTYPTRLIAPHSGAPTVP